MVTFLQLSQKEDAEEEERAESVLLAQKTRIIIFQVLKQRELYIRDLMY